MQRRPARRVLASYVPPQALAPGARQALEGLGYRIVPATTRGRFDDTSWTPDLRLVDDAHLDRLPGRDDPVPLIVMTGRRTGLVDDPRVVGIVAKPAEVATLYPVLQQALEETPRAAARAPTRIQARCTHADRRWTADVLSLSQRGCLLRSPSDLSEGMEFNLLFPLPMGRMVSTRARVQGRHGDCAGLAFKRPSEGSLRAISDYVQRRLVTL
jgi:hypothetical protein